MAIRFSGRLEDPFDEHSAIDVISHGTHVAIQTVQKVSINGSYVLPNGVIVLVDEDLEAYYNGTLVFYDKDNLPVTQ